MIILTGGAGMIGSIIAWHLNTILDRKDIIIVDDIQHADQWNNLSKRTYIDYLDKDDLFPWLEKGHTTICWTNEYGLWTKSSDDGQLTADN
mgnify:CR=1 FL=1